uniref:Uncharacterized protein n=1 Tax=Arundo donax TaxID=35708 RepID=A0A0A9H573_ARUDO
MRKRLTAIVLMGGYRYFRCRSTCCMEGGNDILQSRNMSGQNLGTVG